MNITILGMGKTGHSISCYLMANGHKVTCWDRDSEKLKKIEGGIECSGMMTGHYSPNLEPNIKKAIIGAHCIFVSTIAFGHRDIAKLLKGNLSNGQIILIFNSNWGVIEFEQILGDEITKKSICLAETGGMHLMTDLPEVGHCYIKKIKKKLSVSCWPMNKEKMTFSTLVSIFPQFYLLKSPILTSMDTSNPILHAPIALCSFSKIEGGTDYFFYKEGATPSVVNYIERIDVERLMVMKAIGLNGTSCLDIINNAWNTECKTLYSAIHTNYQSSKGPKSIEYRFITEDIPFGIVPIVKLGKLYGVSTPYCELLVNMYSALMNRDFMKIGPEFNKENIKNFL